MKHSKHLPFGHINRYQPFINVFIDFILLDTITLERSIINHGRFRETEFEGERNNISLYILINQYNDIMVRPYEGTGVIIVTFFSCFPYRKDQSKSVQF